MAKNLLDVKNKINISFYLNRLKLKNKNYHMMFKNENFFTNKIF